MLRVIAGEFKGRKIRTPEGGDTTRPLPDRVRTALFNMLRGHIEGHAVFDGFSGTGIFALEAISRGATRAVSVERDAKVARIIEDNARELGAGERHELVRGDVLGIAALSACPLPVHVVFLDPPYPLMQEPETRGRVMDRLADLAERLDDEGFAIIRTPWPYNDVFDAEGQRVDPLARKLNGSTSVDHITVDHTSDDHFNDDDDDGNADREPEGEQARSAVGVQRVPVELEHPRLEGPETHVYGATAVHWYMKKPAAEHGA